MKLARNVLACAQRIEDEDLADEFLQLHIAAQESLRRCWELRKQAWAVYRDADLVMRGATPPPTPEHDGEEDGCEFC